MLRMAHSSAALALVQPDEETADEEIQPASTKNPLRRRRPVKTSNAAAGAEAVVRALTELQESNQWYRSQLDAYAEVVRGLGAHPIRLGLYFPLLAAWREWEGPR